MSILRSPVAGLAAVGLLLGASAGCAGIRSTPAGTPPAEPPPAVVEPAPPPPPGERGLAEATELLGRGETRRAVAKLEEVIALGAGAPGRAEALYTLALIEARPESPARDVPRARRLLQEVLKSDPEPRREAEARFILALLRIEEERTREIHALQTRLAVSEADADLLRSALEQREEELRRIKEILLGESPGN